MHQVTTKQTKDGYQCTYKSVHYEDGTDRPEVLEQTFTGSTLSKVQGKMSQWLHEQKIRKERVEWLPVERYSN